MTDDFDPWSPDTPPRTLHDSYFKQVFGDPVHAAAELRAVFPALASHIDWSSLSPAPSNVVNAVLQQRVGDLVFHARLMDGGETLVWFLVEHQSTEDRWMAMRVAETALAMWRQWRAHHPDADEVPAIVPVVVYHGARPWRAPTELGDLCALPPATRAAIGQPLMLCRFLLDDLSAIDDEAIRTRRMHALARLALFALARGTAETFFERLVTNWAAELNTALSGALREQGMTFLLYTFHINQHVDPDTAMQRILPVVEPEAKETVMTIADKLMQRGFTQGREQGLTQGREQGLAQGREQGQRALLLRLLERRFGPLPAHVAERVAHASLPDLERWADRVLDATDLDAVLSSS